MKDDPSQRPITVTLTAEEVGAILRWIARHEVPNRHRDKLVNRIYGKLFEPLLRKLSA